jgi:hypothetical protein
MGRKNNETSTTKQSQQAPSEANVGGESGSANESGAVSNPDSLGGGTTNYGTTGSGSKSGNSGISGSNESGMGNSNSGNAENGTY